MIVFFSSSSSFFFVALEIEFDTSETQKAIWKKNILRLCRYQKPTTDSFIHFVSAAYTTVESLCLPFVLSHRKKKKCAVALIIEFHFVKNVRIEFRKGSVCINVPLKIVWVAFICWILALMLYQNAQSQCARASIDHLGLFTCCHCYIYTYKLALLLPFTVFTPRGACVYVTLVYVYFKDIIMARSHKTLSIASM